MAPTIAHLPPAGTIDDAPARRRPLSYRLSRQIFVRGIAVIYLAAFLSIAAQADGLIGRGGLLPVEQFLEDRRDVAATVWRYPTLFWLDDSDATIDGICLGGAMAASLVALGLLQMPMLAACFVLYLSLAVGGQDFFADTPWDSLLLEAGFLAIFIAPWQLSLRVSRQAEPPRLLLWLLWWLLFRLLFGSGLYKLTWEQPAWRDGTALRHYFLVQPLPIFTSWYAGRLPAAVLSIATWGLLFAEVVLPFAILMGRWGRRLVFLPLAIVQVLIAATGNYGFFNYLALILCLSLLDDAAWRGIGRALAAPYRWVMRSAHPVRRRPNNNDGAALEHRWRWPLIVPILLAVFIVPISILQLVLKTPLAGDVPRPWLAVARGISPFRVVNGYGLYGSMPSDRIEMVIEGSLDGVNWRPYEFRYKPGDVTRAPAVTGPHMPRLDWLMWSLRDRDPQEQVWFQALLRGLLENRKQVNALLLSTPYDAEPPIYLRVRAFDYKYSTPEQLAEGYWWRRELLFDSIGGVWLRDRPQTRPSAQPAAAPSPAPTGGLALPSSNDSHLNVIN